LNGCDLLIVQADAISENLKGQTAWSVARGHPDDASRKLPNHLATRKFSDSPQLSDLDGFALQEDDIKELKNAAKGSARFNCPRKRWNSGRKWVGPPPMLRAKWIEWPSK
jgi:hypothetical protein